MLEHGRIRRGHEEHGFTLIELLIVIVVIGILLAIAVPSYLGYRERSQDTVAKTDAVSMTKIVERCKTLRGSYIPLCDNLAELEATNGGPLGLTYGKSGGQVEVDPCTEGELPALSRACPAGTDGFAVIANSRSGNLFLVYNWPGLAGGPKRTCSTAGRGGCGSDGTW